MSEKLISLENELHQLFDIRHARLRDDKIISHEAMDAQRDIRLITHKFKDGIPDITISINSDEDIKWDSQNKRLLLISLESCQILEASCRLTMIRVRPHLALLVKQAIDFYKN
jgi:hypothetical protein